MKNTSLLLFVMLLCSFMGCTNGANQATDNLVEGGIYVSKNDEGTYRVSKILVLDEQAAHVRMYDNEFKTKPVDVSTADLKFLIGHAPMAREGFLLGQPELLKVEKVSEQELEGYKIYLDAMQNQ